VKVLFFQPYLAAWRIEFLDRFIKEFEGDVVVVDGGHSELVDIKSVSSNQTGFGFRKLRSANRIFSTLRFPYPVYFSPGLFGLLRREKPDVVVTEGEINIINNLSVVLYARLYKKHYLWWSLGKVRTRKVGILPRLLRPLVAGMLNGAKFIVARNSLAKTYYTSTMSIDESRIIVAPNSMDEDKARGDVDPDLLERLREGKTGPVLLYVGAMTSAKRPLDLIEAVRILDTRAGGGEGSELWYVGDGPERDKARTAAEAAGISERVKFFGRVTDGVGSYFSAADVVVVPGLGGLVINHAMIFGIPVVSRTADGTELDLIEDGATGQLATDDSNETLAECIENVLKNNAGGEMSRNALRKVNEDWNMKIMISRFREAILTDRDS
jgi:glycosyltransferase involved in cell wall biosynthesis